MRVVAPLLAVSALLLPLSAASQADYKSTLKANCTPGCVATVIVPAGCGSGIRVAPDPIVVEKGKESTIKWNVTGQWEFDKANGIFVHMGGSAFTGHKKSVDGRSFTVVINHPSPATFKYDINLIGPGGTCRIDPIIVNH